MKEISEIKPIRRRVFVKGERAHRLHVPVPSVYLRSLNKLRDDVFKATGVRLTTAHILREGGRRYMLSLRVQVAKAKHGSFHARQRKPGPAGPN